MIKKVIIALMLALPLASMAQAKFGIVNSQEVFQAMPETAKAQADIETASKKYQDEYNKLIEEYQKASQELQELPADTPAGIRERREQSKAELEQRIVQFQNTAAQELQRQQESLAAPIQQRIQDAVRSVGDEGTYVMIFENVVPAYVGASVDDVTAKVKAKLGLK